MSGRTREVTDNCRKETMILLRVLAGIGFICGLYLSMWIWMGLNAGSTFSVWSSVTVWASALVLLAVARILERRSKATLADNKPVMSIATAA